eukprot:snap_masked-scaffold_58-processed-gene-0.46-mRNA-1 protein AED:0.71 eAED:0.71 QI:0/-1/0/1/-1/1/1/0/239
MDAEFKQKCEIKESLHYFQDKLVIPFSLLGDFMVKTHIEKCYPSFTSEKDYYKKFYFHKIKKSDIGDLLKSYRQGCLHCQRDSALLRRPYNITSLTKRSRDIIRADYLYINKQGYIRVLLDSCTRKTMLFHSATSTAQNMANALLSWRAALGFNDHILVITDNGSHFSNNLLETLSNKIGFEQTFSIAYSPWTNGSVETINTTILRCIRNLVSQYRLHESEWPKLLPTITYIINNLHHQ